MKKIAMLSFVSLSLVAGIAGAAAKPAPAAAAPAKKDMRVMASALNWVKPMGDMGPEFAYVSGDPKTGPWQAFLRLKANAAAGWHTHDMDYTGTVIQGTWMHLVQGETTTTGLPPGSFWTQPGKENHDDRCGADGPCTIFIVSAGPQTYTAKTADGKDAPAPAAAATKKK